MEIVLNSCIYAINPRRIIYIEYYRVPPNNGKYVNIENYEFFRENNMIGELNEEEENTFRHKIVIHLTDDKKLDFYINDEKEYKEIRDKLESIVGG